MKNIDSLVNEIVEDSFNDKCNFQLDQNVNLFEGIQSTFPIKRSRNFIVVLAIPRKAVK